MPYYTKGYPRFAIEKPITQPWVKDGVQKKQDSGEYYGELKLNEHRSFLCIDDKGAPTLYTYRHDIPTKVHGPVLDQVRELDLPPSSIFDGGHLWRKAFGDSRLWIFDVLVMNGSKVRKTCEERRQIVQDLFPTSKLIWTPLRCDNFTQEFEAMLKGESTLIKEACLKYGMPYEQLAPFFEGFVLKNKTSKLTFPSNKKEVASYFRLRLADVGEYHRKQMGYKLED